MLQLNFDVFPLLNTERLLLREVSINDADEIFFLRSDKGLLRYLDKHPEKSVEETKIFIERIEENKKNADGVLWGITLKESDKVIGTICYWKMQKQHYRAEIGYVLNQAFHGKGIMQEAMQAVLKYGFEIMKLH